MKLTPSQAITSGRRRSRAPGTPALRFDERLVLNQWILSQFEVDTFIPLTEGLQDTVMKGPQQPRITTRSTMTWAGPARRTRQSVWRRVCV